MLLDFTTISQLKGSDLGGYGPGHVIFNIGGLFEDAHSQSPKISVVSEYIGLCKRNAPTPYSVKGGWFAVGIDIAPV